MSTATATTPTPNPLSGLNWGHIGDLGHCHESLKEPLGCIRAMLDSARAADQAAYARRLEGLEKHMARALGMIADLDQDMKRAMRGEA